MDNPTRYTPEAKSSNSNKGAAISALQQASKMMNWSSAALCGLQMLSCLVWPERARATRWEKDLEKELLWRKRLAVEKDLDLDRVFEASQVSIVFVLFLLGFVSCFLACRV